MSPHAHLGAPGSETCERAAQPFAWLAGEHALQVIQASQLPDPLPLELFVERRSRATINQDRENLVTCYKLFPGRLGVRTNPGASRSLSLMIHDF